MMRRPFDWVAWPAVACALLLACDHSAADLLAPGICPSIDIRNQPEQMSKLRDCQVIEGYLNIVLMEHATEASFVNVSFPLLREVTGYILIYRLKGVRNLGDLFPNLSVIRGMQLFKDFALVIFDNEGLQLLGLHSLSRIEAGAVRIQNNDHLCYANTIDWSRINAEGPQNNIIRANYDTRLCGLCPNALGRRKDHRQLTGQCPADFTDLLLCWDDKHCQKADCPSECGKRACQESGECCHATCLGGCSGPLATDCYVCSNFSLGYGSNRTCIEHCPANTYELQRRCVTEQECRQTAAPLSVGRQHINAYKILLGRSCVYTCPAGYMEVGNKNDSSCQPCPSSGCVRECPGGKVDSVASAEDFRGCTHVRGSLDITVRARGGNTMAVLESTLGEIRSIEGALRVSRAVPVVSLMFLRSLKYIGGRDADKGQSLYIFNNPNLEMLWNWSTHKAIEIAEGRLFIHFNPKLCYRHLIPLKNMTKIPVASFSENEVSQDNNGDQASCYQDTLHLKVSKLFSKVVVLKWNTYCLDDTRKLLGYSIYYIAAEHNVTLYGQRDACSDSKRVRVRVMMPVNSGTVGVDDFSWIVQDVTFDEARNSSKEGPKNKKALLQSPCNTPNQPLFYVLSQLTPYTRYAAYIKTYTTLQDRRGAQSPIIYFKTLPGRPSPPVSVTVDSLKDHSATIKWQPPAMANGTIILYYVEIQANNYNRPKILALNVNNCVNPSALVNMITMRGEDSGDKGDRGEDRGEEGGEGGVAAGGGGGGVGAGAGGMGGEDVRGECACRDDNKPTRFSSVAEQERVESINFENELQNLVYVKIRQSSSANESSSSRIRRSVDASVNSMLVILSDPHSPRSGTNNTNSTDGKYAKSLYYSVPGGVRSLRVGGLRHFSWYTVNVWACRERADNETLDDYEGLWCSDRAHYTFRTLERSNADVVRNLHVEVLPSNKTLPEVNVSWVPPEDPNGFVVAYNVYHSRVEGNNQEWSLSTCTLAEDYEANGRRVSLRILPPGNYSLRVSPITVAGEGNMSKELYAFIPERMAELSYEWVWGVVVACGVIVLLVAGGVWYARRTLLQPNEANKLFASVNPEYVSTVYVPDEWEVPRGNIEFIRELGQGSFGMVYEGLVKNIEKGKPETRCAVKTVNEHATDRERIEFLNEASVMKAFDTFHVVRLLGVVSRGQPTLVVMELMEHGDLKTYLRSHRPDAEASVPKKGVNMQPPTLQNILQMAIEIADGMAYLSAKKFVHRDLAARNCMVAGDLTVKVGDFGMTRDIYETDYYRKGTKGLLPVRWMSPESLKDGVFSSNSDVWSYGVVLWEMATLAMQPYQGLSNEQVVRYVVEGGVMERPEHCPDRLYELMRACWAHRAPARPSFLHLVADLAPAAQPYFRHRSFFHSPQGQEMYALQRTALDEEAEAQEVNVGAVATGSGSNLFGVSGRLASWVRELSSLRSRGSPDAAAEPLQPADRHEPLSIPLRPRTLLAPPPNGTLRDAPAC